MSAFPRHTLEAKDDIKVLYVLGDSHCLSATWQELVIKPGKALATRLKREGSAAIRDALNRNGR
jgi:hypothetical protein